jgi:ABC-type phosphate/phosphonate transport system substrate-binding protein
MISGKKCAVCKRCRAAVGIDWIRLVAFLGFTNACSFTQAAGISPYIIGIQSSFGSNVSDQYFTIVATHLTKFVGSTFKPSRTFRVENLDRANQVEITMLLQSGALDFIVSGLENIVCYEAQVSGLTLLASTTVDILGHEIEGVGAVAFARADSHVTSLADLSGTALSLPDFYGRTALLATQMLAAHGLNLMHDPRLLILREADPAAVAADVLAGTADVGFLLSGTLETLQIREELSMSQLKLLQTGPAGGTVGEADSSHPFWISSALLPDLMLAAGPSVPAAVQRGVLAALLHHPGGGGGGDGHSWLPAKSLAAVRCASPCPSPCLPTSPPRRLHPMPRSLRRAREELSSLSEESASGRGECAREVRVGMPAARRVIRRRRRRRRRRDAAARLGRLQPGPDGRWSCPAPTGGAGGGPAADLHAQVRRRPPFRKTPCAGSRDLAAAVPHWPNFRRRPVPPGSAIN